jgi:steroid delta-isomerase-like uncharacterized protein
LLEEEMMPDSQDIRKTLDDFVNAINDHDVQKAMDCYADDAVRLDPLTGKLEGKDAIRGYYITLFQAFPDCDIRVDNALGADDTLASEWVFSGTNKGKLPPFESLTPTGKHVELSGASFCDLRNGKIATERVHADYGAMLDELGWSPFSLPVGWKGDNRFVCGFVL